MSLQFWVFQDNGSHGKEKILAKNNIRKRLNKGVANSEWWERFSDNSVCRLSHNFLDHYLVLISLNGRKNVLRRWGDFSFRFNVDWVLVEGFEDQVK